MPKKQIPYDYSVLEEKEQPTTPAAMIGENTIKSPADLVEVRKKRQTNVDRDYNKEKPHVTFRLIPKTLHEKAKRIAREEGVLLGELVRLFFEYGIEQYDQDNMPLEPVVVRTGLSLFPETRSKPSVQKSSRKNKWALNTPRTYHGVSSEIKERMDAIADNFHIPVGELARYLLENGVEAYQSGSLVLEKTAVHTRNSLYPEDFPQR